ncbi:hypothetical protein N182_24765 [Sinorhizobium sp. GL2]|nr:hypothetical protein N182_24765 [Sinorhizobium sp. GL2]
MITEIEIEDLGTYRLPNMWQLDRINRIRGPNKEIAFAAFGLGMTIQQFKKLAPEKQQEARRAYLKITSPANVGKRGEL